jgi:uncharacterized protein
MFPALLLAIALSPTGYVTDSAQILSPATTASLNQELSAFTASTTAEIAVVTISSLPSDETIETYANDLFAKWGIGKKGADNGLLLLISKDDRQARIEVGYGLEPIVTDIESAHIISDVIAPAFQQGDYDAGVTQAVEQLESDIEAGGSPSSAANPSQPQFGTGDALYALLFFFLFFGSVLARSKSWWAGGVLGAIMGWVIFTTLLSTLSLALLGLLFDFLVSRTYKNSKLRGLPPPWWIGGGRGGGGGFGGFGGGSSGGGGASGRW